MADKSAAIHHVWCGEPNAIAVDWLSRWTEYASRQPIRTAVSTLPGAPRPAHTSVSSLVEAGSGSADSLSRALRLSWAPTHLVMLEAGLETLVAANYVLPRSLIQETVIIVDLAPDSMLAATTPFGREICAYLSLSMEAAHAGALLFLVRTPMQEAAARAAGLPTLLLPFALPSAVPNGVLDPIAPLEDMEALASCAAGLGLYSEDSGQTDRAALLLEAVNRRARISDAARSRATSCALGDAFARACLDAGGSLVEPAVWFQYLHAVGCTNEGAAFVETRPPNSLDPRSYD